MKKFKLHYAELSNHEDIPCLEFTTSKEMVDFIDSVCVEKNRSMIWLLACDHRADIFISENYFTIKNILKKMSTWKVPGDYYLQEYDSYQEAYIIALDMLNDSEQVTQKVYNNED